ncbi:hypothetical protein MMC11_002315 [Xylographa trunciseda]|nr:hypothetical protein [Xylographa trunciseda]
MADTVRETRQAQGGVIRRVIMEVATEVVLLVVQEQKYPTWGFLESITIAGEDQVDCLQSAPQVKQEVKNHLDFLEHVKAVG